MKSGWLAALIIFPMIGYAMYYCSTLLIDIADKKNLNPRNITEFFVMVLGSGSYYYITITLFGLQFSVCIGYTVFFMQYF